MRGILCDACCADIAWDARKKESGGCSGAVGTIVPGIAGSPGIAGMPERGTPAAGWGGMGTVVE